MVVPWVGVPLAQVIDRFQPLGSAKFVAFETLYDLEQMPGQRSSVLRWPYDEGLRLDEAHHPLAILAVGPAAAGARRDQAALAAGVVW